VTFGQHMRELRQRAGLSQDQLAAATGVNRTFISQIERIAGRGMTLETLVRIAPALGVSAGTIIDLYVVSEDRGRRRRGASDARR
jgi:transcriptional regulator with XRE-family HTH domain